MKVSGKFIESGLSGCFTSGTGSYSASIDVLGTSKGGLAVHTDLTTEWGNSIGSEVLYLPSLIKSGSLAGNTAVIVACNGTGTFTLPDPTAWDNSPAPGIPTRTYVCDTPGRIFVTVVMETTPRTISLDASGSGVVSGP